MGDKDISTKDVKSTTSDDKIMNESSSVKEEKKDKQANGLETVDKGDAGESKKSQDVKSTNELENADVDKDPETTKLERSPEAGEITEKSESSQKEKADTEELSDDEDLEESKIPDVEDPSKLTDKERDDYFTLGKRCLRHKKHDAALKCFLICIRGLSDSTAFRSLAECLHSDEYIKEIASCYYKKEEYEKAIQFIQAEKMYYETALIDIGAVHKKLEMAKVAGEKASRHNSLSNLKDPENEIPEAFRAEEYEHLAKICLEKSHPVLALEYQGKATRIRQKLFGADHEITLNSLDFFTLLYAEVGKQQYYETMEKYTRKDSRKGSKDDHPTSTDESTPATQESNGKEMDDDNSKVKANGDTEKSNDEKTGPETKVDEDPHDSSVVAEREMLASKWVLWCLLFFFTLLLIFLLGFIYCSISDTSRICANWRNIFRYYFMRIKFYIYQYYNQAGQNKYG